MRYVSKEIRARAENAYILAKAGQKILIWMKDVRGDPELYYRPDIGYPLLGDCFEVGIYHQPRIQLEDLIDDIRYTLRVMYGK